MKQGWGGAPPTKSGLPEADVERKLATLVLLWSPWYAWALSEGVLCREEGLAVQQVWGGGRTPGPENRTWRPETGGGVVANVQKMQGVTLN